MRLRRAARRWRKVARAVLKDIRPLFLGDRIRAQARGVRTGQAERGSPSVMTSEPCSCPLLPQGGEEEGALVGAGLEDMEGEGTALHAFPPVSRV